MEKMENKLIVAIINKGFSDVVMEAARRAGAKGGTVVKARGTGNKEMESFYGIVIHPDKEMVLIVTDEETKDKCMEEIYKDCGLETKSQGIIFAMPIDDVKGIN